jgi:hypothetical protein
MGRGLDARDLLADLTGRLRSLLRQRLDFGRHHGKAAAGFAGTCRLDGGIERQQVGLSGNGGDELDDIAVGSCCFRQFAVPIVGLAGLIDGLTGHPRRFLHLAADLIDRRGHFLGRRRHRRHIGGGASSDAAATVVVTSWARTGGRRQRGRGSLQFGRG